MQYESNGFAGIPAPVTKFIAGFCSSEGLIACPTPPPNTQGAMAWAYHNMWAGYFPTFNIALIVGYPIQGHVAKGLRGLAGEETTQSELLMQGVYERIGAEARTALQSYQSALSKLYGRAQRRANRRKPFTPASFANFTRARRRRSWCCSGRCSSMQSRLRELQAQTQLNQSIVEIERVDGTILTTNGVNVQTLGSQALAR